MASRVPARARLSLPTRRRSGPIALLLGAALATGFLAPPSIDPELSTSQAQAQGAQRWSRTAIWMPSFDTESLLNPGGVEPAPGGSFYVADTGHDRVLLLGQQGQVVRTIGSRGDGPRELNAPSDVAFDPNSGRLYVADAGNRRISVFDSNGTPLTSWRSGSPNFGFRPHAVALAPSGEVYVLSRLPWGLVDRFDPSGNWLGGWGDIGQAPGRFDQPEDLTVHPDGRVLVADTINDRIQIFNADGSRVEQVIDLERVSALAVDAATSRIYALFRSSGSAPDVDAVAVYTSSGGLLRSFVPFAPNGILPARGIGVGEGRVGISTGFGAPDGLHGLRQFDARTDAFLSANAVDPSQHSGFIDAVALDVEPDGNVLVVDKAVGLSRRYAPDGSPLASLLEARGDEIGIGPQGTIYLSETPILGDVTLRRVQPDGSQDWIKACDCLSGMGLEGSTRRAYSTDAIGQRIVAFDLGSGSSQPVSELTIPDPPYAWPLDIDGTGPFSEALVAASGEMGIMAFDDQRRSWTALPDSGDASDWSERVSRHQAGSEIYTLLASGRVKISDAGGAFRFQVDPQPAPGFDAVMPSDIAAGPDGRFYLIDRISRAVFVYDLDAGAPTATPSPTAEPEAPCTVTGDKLAAPDILQLGDQATVTLNLDIQCRPGQETRADIVLLLDRSSSMSGEKLEAARAAASRFVQGLDLSRHRVSVLTFSDVVSLDLPLTSSEPALLSALADIRADGTTDIGAALDRALAHLGEDGRPEALPVILLMTDGNPYRVGQPYVHALRLAARARGRGALTYAIGLGEDVDARLLTAIVGAEERYFFAPRPQDLDPIYQQLSQSVGEVAATDLVITDQMGPDVRYVTGSAQPRAQESGDTLTWRLPSAPEGGLSFSLRVEPLRTGRLPTNRMAQAEYLAGGQRYRFEFPIPEILVLDAEPPTATPTRPPSRPGTIYLPILMRDLCQPKDRELGADIVLVLDSSSSMEGDKLRAAVNAATGFLAQVDPRRDRVGLISFDIAARRESVITQDLNAVAQKLQALQTQQGTRIDLGLAKAVEEIYFRGRPGSAKVIVLLSDGRPQVGTEADILRLAREARAENIRTFTVGLGEDVDAALMQGIASSPSDAYQANDVGDLAAIYDRIAAGLPCR